MSRSIESSLEWIRAKLINRTGLRFDDDLSDPKDWATISGNKVHFNDNGQVDIGPAIIKKAMNQKNGKRSGSPNSIFEKNKGSLKGAGWKRYVNARRKAIKSLSDDELSDLLVREGIIDKKKSREACEKVFDDYMDLVAQNGDPTPTKKLMGMPDDDQKLQYKSDESYTYYLKTGTETYITEAGRKRVAKEQIEWILGNIEGATRDWAKKITDCFYEYTTQMYPSDMSQDHRKILDEYVEKDHAYDGTIYRGMNFDDSEAGQKNLQDFLQKLQVGATISMKGNSSWSASEDVANRFALTNSEAVDSVILRCSKNRTASPIKQFSAKYPQEQEVLAHSRTQWTVMGVKKISKNGGRTQYVIDVIETEAYREGENNGTIFKNDPSFNWKPKQVDPKNPYVD